MHFMGNKNFVASTRFPITTTTIKGRVNNNGSDKLTFREPRMVFQHQDTIYYFMFVGYYARGWSFITKKNFTVEQALNGTMYISHQSY